MYIFNSRKLDFFSENTGHIYIVEIIMIVLNEDFEPISLVRYLLMTQKFKYLDLRYIELIFWQKWFIWSFSAYFHCSKPIEVAGIIPNLGFEVCDDVRWGVFFGRLDFLFVWPSKSKESANYGAANSWELICFGYLLVIFFAIIILN